MSKNINGGWVRGQCVMLSFVTRKLKNANELQHYANCDVKILLIFHWCK